MRQRLREALNSRPCRRRGASTSSSRSRRPTIPLFGHPNVVCTPHLGASTNEAQENVALQVAEQMSDYLTARRHHQRHQLSRRSRAEEAPKLKPFIALAEKLGSFAGQLTETGIKKVQIAYEGAVAADEHAGADLGRDRRACFGRCSQDVNVVSAPVVAKERGIVIDE